MSTYMDLGDIPNKISGSVMFSITYFDLDKISIVTAFHKADIQVGKLIYSGSQGY
jgi:hypothetical protein